MAMKVRHFTAEEAQNFLPNDKYVYNPETRQQESIPLDPYFPKNGAWLPDEQLEYTLKYLWPTKHCLDKVVVAQKNATTYTATIPFQVGDRDQDHTGPGHLGFVGEPGTGKTLLANTIRKLFQATSGRIQGVPDATPSDYTGTRFIEYAENPMGEDVRDAIEVIGSDKEDLKAALRVITLALHRASPRQQFQYIKGPGHADIQLLDEMNRFAERVQAAFLENMSEGQITQFGTTYPTDSCVIGTMNPRESKGVVQLGHAFLDRFTHMIYAQSFQEGDLAKILRRTQHMQEIILPELGTWKDAKRVRQYFHNSIGVSHRVQDLMDLTLRRAAEPWKYPRVLQKLDQHPETNFLTKKVFVDCEREEFVDKAVQGRGVTHLEGAARLMAAYNYRPFVTVDDVEKVLLHVCTHRIEYKSVVYQKYMREMGYHLLDKAKRKLIGHMLQAAFWDAKEEIERREVA